MCIKGETLNNFISNKIKIYNFFKIHLLLLLQLYLETLVSHVTKYHKYLEKKMFKISRS